MDESGDWRLVDVGEASEVIRAFGNYWIRKPEDDTEGTMDYKGIIDCVMIMHGAFGFDDVVASCFFLQRTFAQNAW